MINLSVTMEHTRTTKNTYRYDADDPDQAMPFRTLYVQKYAMADGPQDKIKVTLEGLGT